MKNWLWFLSSYAPLWVILAIRFDPTSLRVACAALAVLSTAALLFLLRRHRAERASNEEITVVGDGGAEVSGYIAAYLLPFLSVATPDARELATYAIFILVAGVVYVRSGLLQVNPTVYLLGWRVLAGRQSVSDASEGLAKQVFVITKSDRRVGETLQAERYSDRVYIDHPA